MYETIEIDYLDDGIASLWLNRPNKRNPLSLQTLDELVRAATDMAARDDVKVVIIGGRGASFCAGADLSGFPNPTESGAREAADAGRRMADAIEAMPQITIARLQGWCVGGGLVLAAACDLRVASTDTRFSIPEVDLGIPLAWGGIPRLVREIGPAATKELVVTCRPFDADEALSLGFLNRVADADDLDEHVRALAQAVAARPSQPVRATKRHVDAVTANQVGLNRSWADADSLIASLMNPENFEARERYLKSLKR